MSLNFLGLGFNFGSKDSGLGKSVKKLTHGFHGFKDSFHEAADEADTSTPKMAEGIGLIHKALQKLDELISLNRLQTWIASFSLAKLRDISDGIKDMATNVNLTTPLEGTMVANSKATKALAANFGYTGDAALKFSSKTSSLAYSLNVGTDSATSAQYAMDSYGKALKAVGIDSTATAIKVHEVFGIDIAAFGSQLTGLQKEFGFTDKELSNVVGSMEAFGQQSGDVKGALTKLPELISMVRNKATSLGKTLDASTLADYATQTESLAAGFYTFTNDTEKAQKDAMSISNALIEANVNIGKMFAGTEGDLSKFASGLGIATGDIEKSFKLMKQGPAGFVKGMAGMISDMGGFSKMTGEQANFIQKQLMEAMGPEAGQMVFEFFQKADVSTLKTMSTVKDATSTLGKLGKQAFETGLTLADTFDRAKAGFVKNFRDISRKESVDFVRETGKQFNLFNKQLAGIAAEDGPLGAIVRKFSEMHQIGALSLLPKTLRPLVAVFGSMLSEMTPMIGMLGSLGFRLKMLLSPAMLVIAAATFLGGWFIKLRMEGKSTGDALQIMGDKIHEFAKKAWTAGVKWLGKLVDYLKSIDWGKVLSTIVSGVEDAVGFVANLILDIPWKEIFTGVGAAILKLGDVILVAFQEAFNYLSKIDIGGIVGSLVSILKEVFMAVGHVIGGLFDKVLDLFQYAASKGFRDRLVKIAHSVADGIKHIYTALFDLLDNALDYVAHIDMGAAVTNILNTAKTLFEGWMMLVVVEIETLGKRIPGVLIKLVDIVIKAFMEIPPAIGRFLVSAGAFLKEKLPALVGVLLDAIWSVLQALPGLIVKIVEAIPAIVSRLGDMLKNAVGMVVDAILGIFTGIENWLVKKLPDSAGLIHGIFFALKETVIVIGDAIGVVIDVIVGTFKFLWNAVVGIVKAIYYAFDTFLVTPLKFIVGLVEGVLVTAWNAMSAVVSAVWSVVGPILEKMADGIGFVIDKVSAVGHAIGGALDSVGDFFSSSGNSMYELAKKSIDAKDAVNQVGDAATKSTVTVQQMFATIAAHTADTLRQSAILAANQTQQIYTDLAAGTIKTEQDKFAALGNLQKSFAAESATALAKVPEALQASAKNAAAALNQSYFEQLQAISGMEEKYVGERKEKLAALDAWKRDQLVQFGKVSDEQAMRVAAGQDAALSGMQAAYSAFTSVVTDKAKTAATQNVAVIGSVQKEIGVSADTALDSIKSLSAINPQQFASNLKKIKDTFIQFSKDIAKAFQDAWVSALAITTAAMASIDTMLTTALLKLRGIAGLMDLKVQMDKQTARQKPDASTTKDIRSLGDNERDQELLNATNWPLWYDDYRIQFATLVTSVSMLAPTGSKGGRMTTPNAPAQGTGGTAGLAGVTRGAR